MTCCTCARDFVSDGTPLATMGYCLLCRSDVDVTCTGCGNTCKGAPDGATKCPSCRTQTYFKNWLYADSTGGRLWRHSTTGLPPDF
jgi:hypothetical protein